MPDDPKKPELVPMNPRDAAFHLQRALARKRHGHEKSLMDSAMHQVVGEILAAALADAGVVLATPRYEDPNRQVVKRNPHLTD